MTATTLFGVLLITLAVGFMAGDLCRQIADKQRRRRLRREARWVERQLRARMAMSVKTW